jgi:putative tryptophan/tyrosine transport system substrate-binding protein
MPRIGFLQPGSPSDSGHYAKAFLEGLQINGYSDGKNVAVEYRWAEGQYERMPELAAELVDHGVASHCCRRSGCHFRGTPSVGQPPSR